MVFVEFGWPVDGDGNCFLFDDIADDSADGDDAVADGDVALCCTMGIVDPVIEGVPDFTFPWLTFFHFLLQCSYYGV